MEPTVVDSPLQNKAVKIYNDKLAFWAQTLLYGAGLPAKFWSAALLHSVYLHNWLVHNVVKKTPYGGYYGFKPDIGHLKLFWFARVNQTLQQPSEQTGQTQLQRNFPGVYRYQPQHCLPGP